MSIRSGLVTVGLATAVTIAAAAGAAADDLDMGDFELPNAHSLLDICTAEEAHPNYWEAVSFCYGFFQGGVHYHRALAAGEGFEPIACPPGEISLRQLVSTFVTYAGANPQYLGESPMDTVFRAVADQWPCE